MMELHRNHGGIARTSIKTPTCEKVDGVIAEVARETGSLVDEILAVHRLHETETEIAEENAHVPVPAPAHPPRPSTISRPAAPDAPRIEVGPAAHRFANPTPLTRVNLQKGHARRCAIITGIIIASQTQRWMGMAVVRGAAGETLMRGVRARLK